MCTWYFVCVSADVSVFVCHIYILPIHAFMCVCLFVLAVVIPNAEEIQAARRKRSAIRAQKEFIPLGRDGHSSAGSTPDHYSREDDEDRLNDDEDEPDDHERRIEFAPRLKSIRERIAEKFGMSGRHGNWE